MVDHILYLLWAANGVCKRRKDIVKRVPQTSSERRPMLIPSQPFGSKADPWVRFGRSARGTPARKIGWTFGQRLPHRSDRRMKRQAGQQLRTEAARCSSRRPPRRSRGETRRPAALACAQRTQRKRILCLGGGTVARHLSRLRLARRSRSHDRYRLTAFSSGACRQPPWRLVSPSVGLHVRRRHSQTSIASDNGRCLFGMPA